MAIYTPSRKWLCVCALAKSLPSALSKVHNVSADSNTEFHLQFNTDGLPVFNNSMQCIWPILSLVVKPFISSVCVVALHAGRRKPNCFDEFLQPFADEMVSILQNGVEISAGVTCRVSIHSFVCDAPAMQTLSKQNMWTITKDVISVPSKASTRKKGGWLSTARSQQSDAMPILIFCYCQLSRVQDSVLRNLQVGMVSQFPLDYMHLMLLGLVQRMAREWQDGLLHSCSTCNHQCTAVHCCELCGENAPRVSASVLCSSRVWFMEGNRGKTVPSLPWPSDTEGCAQSQDVRTL